MVKQLPKVTYSDLVKAANRCEIWLSPDPRLDSEPVEGLHTAGGIIEIRATPRTNNFVLTLVHELLHNLYPDLTETQVVKLSQQVYCQLSTEQIWILESKIPDYYQCQSRHFKAKKRQLNRKFPIAAKKQKRSAR